MMTINEIMCLHRLIPVTYSWSGEDYNSAVLKIITVKGVGCYSLIR